MRLARIAGAWLFAAALFAAPLAALPQQSRLDRERARFQAETDPVRRAKALARLGDEKLNALQQELAAGEFDAARNLMEVHLKNVKSTFEGLQASGRDAEKKPDGFRQLEMHIRRSIRSLGEAILSMPHEERERFGEIKGELEEIDRELLRMLFPRRPGRR
jgi:hypothetical protein